MRLSDFSLSLLERLGLAYWIELTTDEPKCLYYFGPFVNTKEAKQHLPGYLEDLESEEARNIQYRIVRCKPEQLTVFDEEPPTRSQTSPTFA
ncbi:MAG: DUF1816 domain-containing protein [Cyanobacteria bacterium P01_E01_bin.42]